MTLRQTVSPLPPRARRLSFFPSRTAFDRISALVKFQSLSYTDSFLTPLLIMVSVEEMDEVRSERILEHFRGYTYPPVLGKPRHWILPVGFQARFWEFLEFPLLSTDVFLLGHPKTGSFAAFYDWGLYPLGFNDVIKFLSRKQGRHGCKK